MFFTLALFVDMAHTCRQSAYHSYTSTPEVSIVRGYTSLMYRFNDIHQSFCF